MAVPGRGVEGVLDEFVQGDGEPVGQGLVSGPLQHQRPELFGVGQGVGVALGVGEEEGQVVFDLDQLLPEAPLLFGGGRLQVVLEPARMASSFWEVLSAILRELTSPLWLSRGTATTRKAIVRKAPRIQKAASLLSRKRAIALFCNVFQKPFQMA